MAYLDRGGVKIYHEVHGERGSPTLLLSHGYSATSAMWAPQIDALKRDYQLVLWDVRGHGQSDSPDDPALYSEAHSVADMAALLDAVGAKSAVIGGLSLGGYLSLAFHVRERARTRALMLFDTGPGYRNDAAREGWNKMAIGRAAELDAKGLAALGTSHEVTVSRHRSAKGLALAARGILVQHDARVIESLPKVAVPTLVLVGSKDEPFLGATDYMAAKIPGATKVVIEGAGHASNLDKPKEFNAAVRSFLTGVQ
jgi:pimeloyl-ACP methyl ester carboxylesterase